ncbi:hypothetical protein AcW1_004663 [Taiwanofungus camphoratus]|nr:hypothetical protein AcV5_001048 [Antrodia cinnamomea]KAI0952649.1 hypothetical protein AcV7_008377 [Antrodia cinnamomea]KAI0960019.1 hypothetical protein AcW1_004663 [Antrodia cinnamomea]
MTFTSWNRFVLQGGDGENNVAHVEGPGSGVSNKGMKPSSQSPTLSLTAAIHDSEHAFLVGENHKHKFEVTLEPSSYSDEKFALYQSYQRQIHLEEDKSPHGFDEFLVKSPLRREPIPYPSGCPAHLPREYGSYHQLYRLDDELIAMGVLDILPNCVSSVYFMYEKKWEKFSMGKLSALRETSLAKEIHDAGVTDMGSLYMGFYIHSCPKMRYKGDYAPSYLADPEDYTWFPVEECRPLLDKFRYVSFAHPEHNIQEPATREAETNQPDFSIAALQGVQLIDGVADEQIVVIPVTVSQAR